MVLLQEAIAAAPLMLIGLIVLIVGVVVVFYIGLYIHKNNNKVADRDLTEEETLAFEKRKRTVSFFWTTVLLMIIAGLGSCVYKACTITFD